MVRARLRSGFKNLRIMTKMCRLHIMCAIVVALCAGAVYAPPAAASVRAKLVVVNPSEQERTLPVKHYLPAEITADDVLETQGLEVSYDHTRGVYFVSGEIDLQPKEGRTLEIILRDIWRIAEEDKDECYELLERKVESLRREGLTGEELDLAAERVKEEIDYLVRRQQESRDDIEKRMQMFSSVRQELEDIKGKIFSLERIAERLAEGKRLEEDQIITLVLTAENRDREPAELTISYDLPPEIREEHIVDNAGFVVRHEPAEDKLFITREDSFQPNEFKNYRLRIKNVWRIPEHELDDYQSEAEELFEELKDTPSSEVAEILKGSIIRNVQRIRLSQESTTNINEVLAIHRMNRQVKDNIESDLEKMRLLKIRQVEEPGGLIMNILRDMEQLDRLRQFSDDLFETAKRSVWQIVYTIVVFVIVFSTVFYVIWYKRMKKDESREFDDIEKEKE